MLTPSVHSCLEAAAPKCNRDWRMSDLSCIELQAESQSFGHPSQGVRPNNEYTECPGAHVLLLL
jgi:hypothetical protein